MKQQTLTIYNLDNTIAYCEAQGLSKVFEAYADNCPREYINTIGFNSSSGYIYLALEDGIQICSMLGRDVEYLVTNFDNGEEYFFDTYDEAIKFDLNNINEAQ